MLSTRQAGAGDDKSGVWYQGTAGKAGLGAPQEKVSKEGVSPSAFLFFLPCSTPSQGKTLP